MQFILSFITYADYPRPWQVSFQKPATTMMEGIIDLHHDIFTFLVIILIFVSFMMGAILYRSQVSFNVNNLRLPVLQYQNAHGITHNTTLEIVWTIIPTLILLLIATPSFALIYALDEIVEPELTIRVVGRQWYWTYEFPDNVSVELPLDVNLRHEVIAHRLTTYTPGVDNFSDEQYANEKARWMAWLPQLPIWRSYFKVDWDHEGFLYINAPGFSFNSYIVPTEDLFPGSFRLLETDRRLVLPFGTNIRVLVTSYDVIHSWTVPSFGIKVDALPGRLNEYYLNINYLGLFYGQCSEICGVNHGFMPIKVEVTTDQQFRWWFLQTSLLENAPIKFRDVLSASKDFNDLTLRTKHGYLTPFDLFELLFTRTKTRSK